MHISLAAIDSKAPNLKFRIDGNNKTYEQAMSLDMKVEANAIFLYNLQLMKDLESLTPQINERMKEFEAERLGLRPPISEDYRSSGEKLTCSSDSSSSRPRVNNTDVIMTQQSPSCATLLTSPVESSYMDEEDEESGEKNEVEEVQEEEQLAKKRSRSGRISRPTKK